MPIYTMNSISTLALPVYASQPSSLPGLNQRATLLVVIPGLALIEPLRLALLTGLARAGYACRPARGECIV